MRLLDRYVLRELLVPLGYCLCGFLLFYVAFDLIFQINRFLDNRLLFLDIVEYYVVTLPELLVEQVLPVSLLLAMLYALTQHSRHNELTAMRAAGVALWRLALPYFAVGALLGVIVFAIGEWWMPSAADRSREILQRRTIPASQRDWVSKLEFSNPTDGSDWTIGRFNRKTSEMIQPKVQWPGAKDNVRTIVARYAVYDGSQWCFYGAEIWDRHAGDPPVYAGTNAILRQSFPETPAWFNGEIKVSEMNPTEAAKGQGAQLSIREILDYLRLHPHTEKRAMLLTQLQGRLAAPFTCLAVVLIALPFGARSGRHNVFVGVASSIFICFGYFILQRLSSGLGVGGYLPPVLAAWLPNVVCSTLGLALLWWMR